MGFIRSMCQTAQSYCDSPGEKGGATPPALLLLLSRLCLDYETATISYILTLTDEQFLVQVNCQLITRGDGGARNAGSWAVPSWLDPGQLPVPNPTSPLPSLCSAPGWQCPQYLLPLCPMHPWLRTSFQ